MSKVQRAKIDAMLRQPHGESPTSIEEARAGFKAMMARMTVPDALRTTQTTLGDRPALQIEPADGPSAGTILYFHGGVWALGSPETALSLTGKKAIREPFGPFAIDVRFVPYGDADALKAAVDERCSAVFLEPTQGEAGVVPPPDGYFTAAREICDATGALFVADEIQSAIGRTGAWFAFQHENARPDVLTLAKGLGGGLPIGACVAFGEHGETFAKGDHGSTFGGNPVSAAAALAVLDTIEKDGLLANAAAVGEVLASGIAAIDHPLLKGVRGRGLWRAAVLTGPYAPAVEAAARDAGFLVNALQPDALRMAPPLILTEEQARSFTTAFPSILDAAASAVKES